MWCRDVPLSVNKQRILKNMALVGATRGRKRWADIRRIAKQETLERLGVEARQDIGKLSKRDRFIAGLMLYAGEGDRTGERVGVSNSNPQILQFVLGWLCEFLDLDRARFTVHLYLHIGRSEKRAKQFWATALYISESQIRYVYRPMPRPSHKRNVHQFGVCSIRYHNKMAHRRLMAWIRAVLNNQNNIFPGSSMAEQLAVDNGQP